MQIIQREILRTRPERVLPSRFAYRDKAFAKRKLNPSTPWRHKSRLVVGGHLDPDITTGNLSTSAPTVSRAGILSLLQLCATRRSADWTASAGDITAAFLNGEPLRRELFIRQGRFSTNASWVSVHKAREGGPFVRWRLASSLRLPFSSSVSVSR